MGEGGVTEIALNFNLQFGQYLKVQGPFENGVRKNSKIILNMTPNIVFETLRELYKLRHLK